MRFLSILISVDETLKCSAVASVLWRSVLHQSVLQFYCFVIKLTHDPQFITEVTTVLRYDLDNDNCHCAHLNMWRERARTQLVNHSNEQMRLYNTHLAHAWISHQSELNFQNLYFFLVRWMHWIENRLNFGPFLIVRRVCSVLRISAKWL